MKDFVDVQQLSRRSHVTSRLRSLLVRNKIVLPNDIERLCKYRNHNNMEES
jgi:hypothetical protein